MERAVEMKGELLLWMRMVSEGLAEEAHLSKTVKQGLAEKTKCKSLEQARHVPGEFKEVLGGQCEEGENGRRWHWGGSQGPAPIGSSGQEELWILSWIYWVGQKVPSCSSINCYGKTWTNFLANAIVGSHWRVFSGKLTSCVFTLSRSFWLFHENSLGQTGWEMMDSAVERVIGSSRIILWSGEVKTWLGGILSLRCLLVCDREKSRMRPGFFAWGNEQMLGSFPQMGADLSRQNQEMICGHVEFEMPISIQAV